MVKSWKNVEEFVKHERFTPGHESALYSRNSECSEELQIWENEMLPVDKRQGVTVQALGGLATMFCAREGTPGAAVFLQGGTFRV